MYKIHKLSKVVLCLTLVTVLGVSIHETAGSLAALLSWELTESVNTNPFVTRLECAQAVYI